MEVCKLVAEVFFFPLSLLSFATYLLAGQTCSYLAAERPKVKLQVSLLALFRLQYTTLGKCSIANKSNLFVVRQLKKQDTIQ